MGGGLIGDDVWDHPTSDQLLEHIGGIADQADATRRAAGLVALDERQGRVQIRCQFVEVAFVQTPLDALRIDVDTEIDRTGNRRGKRLRSTHPAESTGVNKATFKVATEVFFAAGSEGLIGALQDALRADVDPRSGRHLAVHHQTLFF